MVNPMDPVLSHRTSQERQPAAVPELPNNKPHQSPKQSHAEDLTEQIEATSGEDHRLRTGRLQSRREHTEQIFNLRILCEKHLQHQHDLYHVFIDFKKGLRQGLACSFVGNHEEVQHQHKPIQVIQKPL